MICTYLNKQQILFTALVFCVSNIIALLMMRKQLELNSIYAVKVVRVTADLKLNK